MGSEVLDTVIGFVFLALVVGLGFYLAGIRSVDDFRKWLASRSLERASGIEVSASPAEVLDRATEYMARCGYGVETRTASSATFARSAQMDPALGCFLALLFLLPALIYMLLVAGKTKRVTVAAYPHGSGSRVVIGGDGRTDVARLKEHVRVLG